MNTTPQTSTEQQALAEPMAIVSVRKMEPEFKLALPTHIDSARFTRIAVSAVNSNPDLLKADVDRRALLAACMKAAQDGLVIDNREAAIVMFGNKPQYMPMIAGVLKKMRNSGEIANIGYGIVFENEWKQGKFEYIKGDNESLKHTPILFEEKGDFIGVYAVVTLKDGTKVREFMDKKQIEKVRNVSRSKGNGPWVAWYEEMAVKSVLRKVSKLCPMSSDLDEMYKREDGDDDFETTNPETGEVTQGKKAGKRVADRVSAAVNQQPEMKNADPAQGDGKIIEGQVDQPAPPPAAAAPVNDDIPI